MIIKRQQVDRFLTPPEPRAEVLTPWAEDADWSPEALESGQQADRRNTDRRRGYRRIEDQHLVSRAQEEADQIREAARQEGFDAGVADAAEAMQALQDSFDQLLLGRESGLAMMADELSRLAVEIAERILKTEVSCDDTLVQRLVEETVQKAGRDTRSILIKVHPDEAEGVKAWTKTLRVDADVSVKAEDQLPLGSCVVETDSGLIDASFSTQLSILRRLLGLG
jgi:flagellar assembly protein FliH